MILCATTTKVGAVAFNGLTELFSAEANNRFGSQRLSGTGQEWCVRAWNGQTLTWSQWQGFGHDVNGTLHLDA